MSDHTPETIIREALHCSIQTEARLERERDEARAENERLREELDTAHNLVNKYASYYVEAIAFRCDIHAIAHDESRTPHARLTDIRAAFAAAQEPLAEGGDRS